MMCSGGSRTAATSKIERLAIIVNGWKPLAIITKGSILDVAAVLDQPHVFVLIRIIQRITLLDTTFYSSRIFRAVTLNSSWTYPNE